MRDLSILIPSRNEPFLKNTIEDVLSAIEADTEIIAVCDGSPPVEGIEDHPRVTLVIKQPAIGQRAATNLAARLSKAKYVMKLDAHCRLSKGFDAALIKDCQPEWTMVPLQYNLHVFDWKCKACENRTYQGPTPTRCQKCGKSEGFERVMVWEPRWSRKTEGWRFDKTLHFQYWGELKDRPEIIAQGDIHDTLSLLGACWFLERKRYWELDGCDEGHGSWGQQGTEMACKTWLSGGRLCVSRHAWFAHMFRTQGGDFGFPYNISGTDQEKARQYSRNLWVGNRWPKAKHKLEWLIDKFKPIPDWHDGEEYKPSVSLSPTIVKKQQTPGIIYYTDVRLDDRIFEAAQKQLLRSVNGHQIVSVSLGKAIDFGENLILHRARGAKTLFLQILAGLEKSSADYVFLCEHDCLYPKEHFDFVPEQNNVYYYDEHCYKVSAVTGQAMFYYTKQLSGLCANRLLLIEHYYKRLGKMTQNVRDLIARGETVKNDGHSRHAGWEPGCHMYPRGVDNYKAERWMSKVPYIDIRDHGFNHTLTRWKIEDFRDKNACQGFKLVDEVPGWGKTKGRFQEFLAEISCNQPPT